MEKKITMSGYEKTKIRYIKVLYRSMSILRPFWSWNRSYPFDIQRSCVCN